MHKSTRKKDINMRIILKWWKSRQKLKILPSAISFKSKVKTISIGHWTNPKSTKNPVFTSTNKISTIPGQSPNFKLGNRRTQFLSIFLNIYSTQHHARKKIPLFMPLKTITYSLILKILPLMSFHFYLQLLSYMPPATLF